MHLVSYDTSHRNQLASDWMHRGIDLVNENSATAFEQAVRCFDEAIALRLTLPLEENHFFRYGLSAGWINRGDAQARLGNDHSLVEAIKSYDEALVLLESLPLEENILYPRRLAITWINRGVALQKQEIPGNLWEAAECFREAIRVLEPFPISSMTDGLSLRAGAWSNLASVMASSGDAFSDEARDAARKTLALTKSFEHADAVLAEAALKARHAFCRLILKDFLDRKSVSKDLITEGTDAVDDALILARHWKLKKHVGFETMAREIFRLGCRIYGNAQPHFLAEFLMEYLDLEKSEAGISLDEETVASAQAGIWTAFEHLQMDGFSFVGTQRFEPFLGDIQELKRVEERLRSMQLRDQVAV